MRNRMEQLKEVARAGYEPAVWAVEEIERLRAKLQDGRTHHTRTWYCHDCGASGLVCRVYDISVQALLEGTTK